MELTLNIRYMGQEAERGLKFLHDLDIGYENQHKFFEVFTIFACSFTAVQYHVWPNLCLLKSGRR